ncbi:MAG: hypothetical protein CBD26_03495 [Candidatus Pelagibacter sp. TMED166]|nr:MAG: hypothetical protein CBD26_03495 [Candidatus Pelagibacter sp. TMED166]|tara:strand:+ start:3288 stop:4373 length:1086 start_codon:yes stop_codon:yes gene_type:complete
MAFLDNSGDIILDAVLTDTGRHRMARGDFRITKFALGDDEIDYSLYNKSHPSGSAYYDLEILKTPVLESFTNNTSLMKSKLVTIGRTDFLYMPIVKLHDGGNPGPVASPLSDEDKNRAGTSGVNSKLTKLHSQFRSYVVTVSYETDQKVVYTGGTPLEGSGIILGANNSPPAGNQEEFNANPNYILIETGLDTVNLSAKQALSNDLRDNMFIIEMDSRLGSLIGHDSSAPGAGTPQMMPVSYIDDDGIASYVISNALVAGPVDNLAQTQVGSEKITQSRIRGPRGDRLQFSILPHTNLRDTDYFFTRLGGTFTGDGGSDAVPGNGFTSTGSPTIKFIDTFVRVIGGTTGYTIDIPIRYVKF